MLGRLLFRQKNNHLFSGCLKGAFYLSDSVFSIQEAVYGSVFVIKIMGILRKICLTHVDRWDIMYNCDVRWKCLGQSPGVGILL